ncbi:hypothetical protein GCM10009117_05060 [Gangjinia marincola]|uniref:Secretion system C-terminal sorting domain-containing protein n=1 Tax=Gangjinia marincola TaxID=578463 RepID=A0ABN1ME31_9FLAO
MKKIILGTAALIASAVSFAQNTFESQLQVDVDWEATEVVMPPSPFQFQVIFVGGEDQVQTGINESVPAKQWHDFIGFTPFNDNDDCTDDPNVLGWVSVNHEMIISDDKIGDGGGMTAFLLGRDPVTDELYVIDQKLTDGREGSFFNVDFANVGETGMNCGGINSGIDGRIWTAEEWFRNSNDDITPAVRDLSDYTIKYTELEFANFQTIEKYQNFNWMVEVDPRQAKAIRKQYNWGRQPFEGGTVANDNRTVYTGADATPGFFTKFVADIPGDFTNGSLYVYKHDAAGGDGNWVEIDNEDFDKMLNYADEAVAGGATMFNRLEWVAYNKNTGKVYMTETGRDNPASRWADEAAAGAVYAPHHIARATEQGATGPDDDNYWDYYGRILEYDPATDEVTVFFEGGPFFDESPTLANYPDKHISNPDGLNFLYTNVDGEDKTFMLVQEDLNGTSFGRTPAEYPNDRMCEMYILDMSVDNPTIDNMIRLTQTPRGAEITGAVGTPDGKSVLVNSQHPSTDNPFPYNNSLTFAITGFDNADAIGALSTPDFDGKPEEGFSVYPNAVEEILYFNKVTDIAIYDLTGKRIAVKRQAKSYDTQHMSAGTYLIKTAEGEGVKFIKK